MCLLVFAWKTEPGFPLVVAANRDERLDRPAHSLCVLSEHSPRILGGRDDVAGGTWLAVNEHGVVAGLTNRPSPGGRDPTKRSRGELPLVLAGQRDAAAGVSELVRKVQPGQYNPAWLLVGDRESLFTIELASDLPPAVRRLSPGVHVLENVGLGEPSPKVDRMRSLLGAAASGAAPLWAILPSVLSDHTIPPVGEEPREDDTMTAPAGHAGVVRPHRGVRHTVGRPDPHRVRPRGGPRAAGGRRASVHIPLRGRGLQRMNRGTATPAAGRRRARWSRAGRAPTGRLRPSPRGSG